MLVIGIGNELCGDDGVGPWIVKHIAAAHWPGVSAVELGSSDLTLLLDIWQDFSFVYLVDAVLAAYPVGTIIRVNCYNQDQITDVNMISTHHCNLLEVIKLARMLEMLPPRLFLYGIVGRSFQIGSGLSPEVEGAARTVATRLWRVAKHLERTLPYPNLRSNA